MIPKHLHFVWIGGKVPWWADRNMQRFRELNPDFEFTLHNDSVLLNCFRHAYFRVKGEHLYSRRSDLLRLSALMRFGGWYFDCDFLPIRPLSELYVRYGSFPRDCFITHCAYLRGRPWIANGVIGTTRDSLFLAAVVAEIMRRSEFDKEIRWESYGPGVFTPLSEQYPELVHMGELDGFYRLQDRKASMAAYRRIADAGYTREAIVGALGEPLPYMLHQSQMDALEV